MKKVNVERDKLLATVQANRDSHYATYESALEGYKNKVRQELEAYLARIEQGDILHVRVVLPMPEEHLDDYDRALKMLEMSVDDVVELTEDRFAELVMDDWGWQKSFTANTVYYVQES